MLKDELKRLRIEKKLTQNQLADALNVSQSLVTCWERGTRQPTTDFIPIIAEFYGVSADSLLGMVTEEPQDPDQPYQIKTEEVRILAPYMDRMPKDKRELLVNMAKLIFEGSTDQHDNNTES